jgi:DNA adenine methylase
LDLLPQTRQYVEPFGGSAAVLINKEPSPIETYNDIDSEVFNFFEVLQTEKDELLQRLHNTPHSREFFQKACTEGPEDNVERALFFLIRTAQAFDGVSGSSWASSKTVERRGMPQRTAAWDSRREQIEKTAERLMGVQIENRPAQDVINRHDDEQTLFYCDPPYPPEARESTGQYNHEMDATEHEELADTLRDCVGHVALSGYQCELLDELYDGWFVIDGETKTLAGEGTGERTEVLYTNYDTKDLGDGV